MNTLRASARLCLLAALILPALAFFPPLMHVFDTPKSAVWEPFAALAFCLAWSLPGPAPAFAPGSPSPKRPGGTPWRLWPLLWILTALAAAGSALVQRFHWPNFLLIALFHVPVEWYFRVPEAVAAATLAEWALRSRRAPLHPLPSLALGMAALWSLSASFSFRPDLATPTMLDWAGYLLVFGAAWKLAPDSGARARLLAAILFVSALNALYGLVQAAGYDVIPWAERFDGRATGFFGNPNFLGGHMALSLPLALALALKPSRGTRSAILRWGLVWLLGAALFASQTRGAWAGAALGCLVVLWGARRFEPDLLGRNRKALALGALVLALGVAGWWLRSPSQARARITGVFFGDQEASRRAFLMEKTAALALEHPLLGVGPGAFRVWFPSVEVKGLKPEAYDTQPYIVSEHGHNDILQMAADAGWPAALLLAALFALVLWRLAKGLPLPQKTVVVGAFGAPKAVLPEGSSDAPPQGTEARSVQAALAPGAPWAVQEKAPEAGPEGPGSAVQGRASEAGPEGPVSEVQEKAPEAGPEGLGSTVQGKAPEAGPEGPGSAVQEKAPEAGPEGPASAVQEKAPEAGPEGPASAVQEKAPEALAKARPGGPRPGSAAEAVPDAPGEAYALAGILGALVALIVHGLANFPFLIPPTQGTAWALAALGLRCLEPEARAMAPSGRVGWRMILFGLAAFGALFAAREMQLFEDGMWWVGAGELHLQQAVQATNTLLRSTAFDRREDRLWNLHGQAQFARGNIRDSIGSLREAHRLNPFDAEVALRLGRSLIENKYYAEAYTVLNSAVAYAPNLPDLWEPLAVASYEQNKFEDAVKAYDWMLYFHINEESAYTNKAAALGNLGRLPESLVTLLDAEKRFPTDGKVQINLAITYYKMGLRRQAYEAWKKAAQWTPSDPQVDSLRSAMKP